MNPVPCAPVPSTYLRSNNTVVVQKSETDGIFIYQTEVVTDPDNPPVTLNVAYNPNGLYIGSRESVLMLQQRGITQVELAKPDHTICSIGYNAVENKWYGWSHRAIYGFGIDSVVERGDCAYVPVDKEDVLRDIQAFWDHGIAQKGGGKNAHMTFTTNITNVRFDVEQNGVSGLLYDKLCACSDPNGPSLSSIDDFEPYPVPWGRGEWRALTLDDAKEMAIAFAAGVS